jgi:hypothetical protein
MLDSVNGHRRRDGQAGRDAGEDVLERGPAVVVGGR